MSGSGFGPSKAGQYVSHAGKKPTYDSSIKSDKGKSYDFKPWTKSLFGASKKERDEEAQFKKSREEFKKLQPGHTDGRYSNTSFDNNYAMENQSAENVAKIDFQGNIDQRNLDDARRAKKEAEKHPKPKETRVDSLKTRAVPGASSRGYGGASGGASGGGYRTSSTSGHGGTLRTGHGRTSVSGSARPGYSSRPRYSSLYGQCLQR